MLSLLLLLSGEFSNISSKVPSVQVLTNSYAKLKTLSQLYDSGGYS
jgi:hypothetical protein